MLFRSTLQTPISLPYETSFENNLDNWIFKNEDLSNAFYIGNATSFDGNGCLYISNDYGVSNNYTTDVSNVTSYAYRMFYLEPGQYNVSYKWKAQGESTYDYGRAFIVPGDKLLNSGDEQFSYSGSPLNWIPIDNSYGLNLQSEWQSQSSNITIEKPGNYNVVFGWRNNDSRGYQTPLAIDSLAIDYLPCFSPVVMIDRIYDDKVFLRLYNNGDSVRIKVFSTEIPLDDISISTADILDTNVIGQYYEVNNLDESSEYYVYTKGY